MKHNGHTHPENCSNVSMDSLRIERKELIQGRLRPRMSHAA